MRSPACHMLCLSEEAFLQLNNEDFMLHLVSASSGHSSPPLHPPTRTAVLL
jgi:hypothetical protein